MFASTLQPEPDVRQSRRSQRFAARHVLWKISRVPRRRECGATVRASEGVSVKVTTAADGSRHAGFSGLSSCGSVWACPVCSATIANTRQQEIEAALTEWTRRGGRVVLGTVTMRHYQRHELGALWDALSGARHLMLSGRAWTGEQSDYGTPMARTVKTGRRAGTVVIADRVPVISVVEVTHGVNGWHVHCHLLLLVAGTMGPAAVQEMGAGLFGRWSDALVAAGLPAPSWEHGHDWRLLVGDAGKALGEYFTKSVYSSGDAVRSASMEVARGDFKDASHGNRTPFGVLRGLVAAVTTGDLGPRLTPASVERDENLWHDWESGSAGRRQIAWSSGLREWLAVLPVEELTDQELVDVDVAGDETHPVTGLAWAAVRRSRAGAILLEAFETSEDIGCRSLARFEAAGFRWEASHQPG